MMVDKGNTPLFGINITGYVKGEFGLGESSRAQIRSIKAADIPHTICNIDSNVHRSLDATITDDEFTTDNPYAINLLNFNAEAMPEFLDNIGPDYLKGKYNIGYWAWELPTFPPEWEWLFQYYDEIWVPSGYCAEALSVVSPVPVVKIMHSISLPAPSIDRGTINFPKDKFIFLFMFDFHSTLARKNPIGIIEAFKRAFKNTNQDVMLFIKSSNGKHYPEQVELLKDIASSHPSIQFIEGHLKKEEVNALFYNCDCYVSLHRAEGFGLTMAEAMYYGKPVIATGYSSNIEFMNVGNSFLVKYDLIKVTQDSGSYKKGNIWADPDVEHTAALMHYVFHNYAYARQVGLRAAREVKDKLSPLTIGKKIRHRLEHIMSSVALNMHDDTSDNLQALAWKQTAQELQEELDKSKLEIKQLKAKINLSHV
jgi:glycosyltransferase involved in cell wall biosynthesis